MKYYEYPEPLLPGIPPAPTGKRFTSAVQIDYQKRKLRLASRLPVLKPEDLVGALEMPFYQILLKNLVASGYSMVADEINKLLRKEERERNKLSKLKSRMFQVKLIDEPEVLQKIADTLKLEQALLMEGKKESAILTCKQLADQFLLQDKAMWLARHFYLAVLNRCRTICPTTTDRLQAEIHCLLAYIARESNESLESALAVAIDHLAVCRTLSRDRNWQFKPNTILIRLKRPMAFYGINTDDVYETVDACSMSLYMIASLLEHELLISLANQIMHSPHHKAPTDEDLKNAHEFADLALQLALEVRQPVALSSALTRFGIVLRHVGAFEDAMPYFQQLQQHAMLIADHATEAIAYHNMGLCFIGLQNCVEALECFAKQRELACALPTKELEGNSMHEIGHLLLQEGHLWESEECYAIAFESFYQAHSERNAGLSLDGKDFDGPHRSSESSRGAHNIAQTQTHHESVNRCDMAWGMAGVSAGQKLWARLAGLCQSAKPRDMRTVLDFKCGRKPLRSVGRPDYTVQDVSEMKRPWELLQNEGPKRSDDDGEIEWDTDFSFASDHPRKIKKKIEVDFNNLIIEKALQNDSDETEAMLTLQKVALQTEEATSRAEEIKMRSMSMSLHQSRRSIAIEKDVSMRKSLMIAISRRSIFSPTNQALLDRLPTLSQGEMAMELDSAPEPEFDD